MYIDFSENRLGFFNEFTQFQFDSIEKQNIINLNGYSSYSYVFVDFKDSEVTFLR